MSNIDLDKLLSNYLENINLKNPNPEGSPFVDMAKMIKESAAKVCIDILKEYENLKAHQQDD